MIRFLVADDSRAFRAILRDHPRAVAGDRGGGRGADGARGGGQVLALRPDVVTMDVRMPGKDGLAGHRGDHAPARRRRSWWSRPRRVPSGRSSRSGRSSSARWRCWPSRGRRTRGRFEREAEAIRMRGPRGGGPEARHPPPRARRRSAAAPAAPPRRAGAPAARPAARVQPPAQPRGSSGIAASTGGPAALARILRDALPREFPAPSWSCSTSPTGFEGGLVHWLAGARRASRVKLAEERRAAPTPATVYIGAGRDATWAQRAGQRAAPGREPVRGFRPSGTILFRSLAHGTAPSAAGLVLSGMGDDGADGLKLLRDSRRLDRRAGTRSPRSSTACPGWRRRRGRVAREPGAGGDRRPR